jgi:hypothetical protein
MTLRLLFVATALALVGCAGATNGKVQVDHPIYEYQPPEEFEPEEPDEPEEPEEPEDEEEAED